MGCACGESKANQEYIVTLPNKSTKTVSSEMAARTEITKAGGGSYRRK